MQSQAFESFRRGSVARVAKRQALRLVACAIAALACHCEGGARPGLDASVETLPPDPGPSDACVTRSPSHRHAHGHEYTYVVEAISTTPDDPDRPMIGFDLDGRYSEETDPHGCGHVDYVSSYEDQPNCAVVDANGGCTTPLAGRCVSGPGCRGSVDNSMATLEYGGGTHATPSSQQLDEELAASEVVWLIRLANVDNDVEDPSVDVYLFSGFATFADDCGRVVSGREYAIDTASLLPGGTTADEALFHAIGAIHNGRLSVATCGAAGFSLRHSTTFVFAPTLRAVHLAADVHSDRLDRGAFGAWVRVSDFLDFVRAHSPDYLPVVRDVLGHVVDIELDGICADPMTDRYGAISMGYDFRASAATISNAIPLADAPIPGACGSPPQSRPDVLVVDVPIAPPSDVPTLCPDHDGGLGVVDMQRDVDNCGSCNARCCSGQTCQGGRCIERCTETICPAPLVGGRCTFVCTRLVDDDANCGYCGHSCDGGTHCVSSVCR